jgi:hypothetical protein
MNRTRLWRCPTCRRGFANRNQSHACGRHTLAHHFRGKPPAVRALFDEVLAAVRAIGPVRVLPEKTRIAFQVRMSFAQVTPRRHWLDGHLVLARRLEHPRFRRVETFSPRNHLHAFRLAGPGDIDPEFRAWLAEAYRVGEQHHLLVPAESRTALRHTVAAVTESDFRRIALGMNGAVEGTHMGHPDFRRDGRIFASLHHDRAWGMVKLTPDQQRDFLREAPTAFKPESGAWGRQGCTAVRLDAVGEDALGEALTLAWQNLVPTRRPAAGRTRSKRPRR